MTLSPPPSPMHFPTQLSVRTPTLASALSLTTKILIVDDSAVMRSLLRSVVLTDPRLEVIGAAADGLAALKLLDTLRPDLIVLDVEMPIMDGLSTLKQIRSSGRRLPIIMCSALTQRGAQVTLEALSNGAADYVAKPSGQASPAAAIEQLAGDLIPKILALTASRLKPATSVLSSASQPPGPPAHSSTSVLGRGTYVQSPAPSSQTLKQPAFQPPVQPATQSLFSPPALLTPPPYPQASLSSAPPALPPTITVPPEILLIGVSTGGPNALDVLLPRLPADFPLPVLIVQHMPTLFTKMLAERLNSHCPLNVLEATEGAQVKPGTVHIAKGDWHMSLGAYPALSPSSNGQPRITIRLNQGPLENHCRPAVDVLFRSAVAIYGPKILGIILTGMGSDGLAGCRLIRERGGTVFAQDEPTSAVWGMPGAVAQAGLANRILPLNQIAPEILRFVNRKPREATELRESAVRS